MVMIAANEHTLRERFVHRNAAKRHSLIFFLFVSYDRPCRIGMFLGPGNNRRQPAPCFSNERGELPVLV